MRSPSTHREPAASSRRRSGVALLLTVILLLMISVIGISAIDRSQDESVGGARARTTARSFHAADAGVQLALSRISQEPPLLDPFDVALDGVAVQSRARSDATPQQLQGAGIGPPPEGWEINIGSGYVTELFLANVTATTPGGSLSEIEAKLGKTTPGHGGH